MSPRVLSGVRGATVLLLCALAAPAQGQSGPSGLGKDAQPRPDIVQAWLKRFGEADTNLRAGNWKKARAISNNLLYEMSTRIQDGPGADWLLARGLLLRALAEAGLGQVEDAEWDWYAAQALNPKTAKTDLALYGKAGEILRAAEPLSEKRNEGIKDCGSSEDTLKEPCKDVTPPVKRFAPSPDYPPAVAAGCLEGLLVLETVIDERGTVSKPRLLETPGGPLMSFATLEAVRRWKFKPAMLDGQPVKAYYTLTVNFTAPHCR